MIKMQPFTQNNGPYGYGHPFNNTFLNHHGSSGPSHVNGNAHRINQGLSQQNISPFGQSNVQQTPNSHRNDLLHDNRTPAPTPSNPIRAKEFEYLALSRSASSPHHHARAAQLKRRGHGSSALTIMDPKDKMSSTKKSSKSEEDQLRTMIKAVPTGGSPPDVEKDLPDGDQTWSTLDMGGMSLKNLSPSLFAYSFLTALYIPYNQLTSLPPLLCTLSALVRLDASSNKLTSIPSEIGALTTLRELFLFDNQLAVLPPELGTLYLLDILGVEGNPLQESLKSIVDKDGTAGLISFLRDSCPVPMPPPDREWIAIEPGIDEIPVVEAVDEMAQDGFSVLCYNILCEKMATPQMYGYTPSWALSWEYRKELILQEVMGYAADILCLQEVDMEQYEEYFLHNLSQHDYEGIYWPRSRARTMSEEEKRHVDGEAIFYKSTAFTLVEQQLIEFNQIAMRRPDFKKTEDMFNRVMTKDHIAVVALLEHKQTGARLVVATAHTEWRADFKDVKLVQVAMMMDEIERIVDRFARLPPRLDIPNAPAYGPGSGNKIPTIVCGDYNSLPTSGVHEFFSKGGVSANHPDFGDYIYGNYTSDGLSHNLNLKSAYSSIGELPFTNYTPGFKGVIDYIWYTQDTLTVTGVLGEVDPTYLGKVIGFPNAHYPSDHICILSEFKPKPFKIKARS